jgi:hypothetical protein
VRSYDPQFLERMIRLTLSGSAYLCPEELERYLGGHRRLYRRFPAEAWLRRREPSFREFHRRGLARIGEDIDRSRFPGDAIHVILHRTARPPAAARWPGRRVRDLHRPG